MNNLPQDYINDARNFQVAGQYDLAINSLEYAQQLDVNNKYYSEIQKLLCFNYRKLGNFNMALLYINNAINSFSNIDTENQKEYAICLMNKGVIYDEQSSFIKALDCYLPALNIFKAICDNETDSYGLIINALFNVGTLYYKIHDYKNATKHFKASIPYFGDCKETDVRYLTIMKILSEIDNNNNNYESKENI